MRWGIYMKKKLFYDYWKIYEPMIQAVVELFHPFVEAAVHDIEDGKVIALYHNISKRNVGDVSPLKELKVKTEHFPDYFNPYEKKNWDGKPLKCTSITIRNEKKRAIGLICFNVDTSFMHDAHRLIETFLNINQDSENPIEMYGGQCEEQAKALINQYLKTRGLSFNHLSRDQNKELVQHLYHQGIFNYKNAAPFVAEYLGISRATVYNYIKQLGGT